MIYVLILIIATGILLVYLITSLTSSIRVKTIDCVPPLLSKEKFVHREPVVRTNGNIALIKMENDLRRLAYKDVKMKLNESFYNDTDMKSNYSLIIIYCSKTKTPLLSARYYHVSESIIEEVNYNHITTSSKTDLLALDQIDKSKLFLCDRLSGNVNEIKYQKKRQYLFALFYSEILRVNKNKYLILFARSETNERLLTKYIRIGFNIIGKKMHHRKEHWILISDLSKSYDFKWKLVQFFFQLRLLQFILKFKF